MKKQKTLKICKIQPGDLFSCKESPKDTVEVLSIDGKTQITICDPRNKSVTSNTTIKALLEVYTPTKEE